jgi:hypothetical protein
MTLDTHTARRLKANAIPAPSTIVAAEGGTDG